MSRGSAAVMTVLATVLLAAPVRAQDAAAPSTANDAFMPFSGDDLLFMEVTADGYELAETMNVYASRSGIYVPLGEFARIVDFAVGVFPGQGRAEGWIMARDNTLVVDLGRGMARVGGVDIPVQPGQAQIYQDDIYLRTDLLEKLLPLRLKADVHAQTLSVTPTRPLPFQQKLAREQRQAGTTTGRASPRYRTLTTPYLLFSPPAFDINVGGQFTRDGQDQSRSYDARMAGDLLWAGFQGFVGSDAEGELSSARVLFERKDPDGRAIGLFGGTRAGAGDVYTPSMTIGAGSFGGRGVFYTSAPLESLDLATPLNLRGELPLGEEVELYVNEVLQRGQSSPVQGRYEFVNVPLTFGMNTIRLIFYGAQGQTREEVRRINFGAGQVEAGQFILRLGAVQQNRPVFEIGPAPADPSTGASRFVALFDYGISPILTLSGGAARFTPLDGEARDVALLGLRGSFGAVAAQFDLATDDVGGTGASIGIAARPFGLSVVGRHAEYGGGFVDETRLFGRGGSASPIRSSELRADTTLRHLSTLVLPLSISARRQAFSDESGQFVADLRTSAPIGRYYLSSSLAYQDDWTFEAHRRQLVGALDIATLVAARVQFRGGLTYRLTPRNDLETAYATLDYQLTERNTVRVGVLHSLGLVSTTTIQASSLYSADRFNITLNAAYDTGKGDWRVGFQLGFGIGRDPATGRYDIVRPGISTGGSAAIDAYVDANGDGVRQATEQGVSRVSVNTSGGRAVTDARGHALAVGLGDGAAVRADVDLEGIDDPFLVGGEDVRFVPRPGRTALIEVPLQTTSEVELTVRMHRPDAPDRTIAALDLRLVPDRGDPITGRTDHAGTLVLEGVRPGRYSVQLDPTQAETLGLALEAEASVVVPPQGGFVRADDVFIVVTPRARP